jgi:DNA-binding GntR family transcriptional regulator
MRLANAISRRMSRPQLERSRTKLPDRVYKKLKQQILTCRLAPEHRLIESELCAVLDVSRTPLREAFNRLSLEGLVIAAPPSGYIVAPLTIEDIRDLTELRRAVESEAAALAAQRATPEDIRVMESSATFSYKQGDRSTYASNLERNRSFHLAIARASHNSRLEAIVTSVLDQVQRAIYFGLDAAIDAKLATAEHFQLIAAIKSRSPRKARELMAAQIKTGQKAILKAYTQLDL